MTDDDFWANRYSFRTPIVQLETAADLLDACANAVLIGDSTRAATLGRQADMPELWLYADSIMGKTNRDIHRFRAVLSAGHPVLKVKSRMPVPSAVAAIGQRDGWRCRFCGCRVVSKQGRTCLVAALPEVFRWGSKNSEIHPALIALSATADHVVPHARGGTNEFDNLVTACWPCNFGRNNWLLEEVGLHDPRSRPPIVDGWDGLIRLAKQPSQRTPSP
jgi:hypothetical protein